MLLQSHNSLIITSHEVIAYYTRLRMGEDCAPELNKVTNRGHSNSEWLRILSPYSRQAFCL